MMRASELVKALEEAIALHGDHLVYVQSTHGHYCDQPVLDVNAETFSQRQPNGAVPEWPVLTLRHTDGEPG